MSFRTSRRHLLRTVAATGAALAVGPLDFLRVLPAVSADEAQTKPRLVKLDSGIEPMVELLERTPREQIIDAVAGAIRKGTAYQEVLAGQMLATVRNVQPRPAVGFKFHNHSFN